MQPTDSVEVRLLAGNTLGGAAPSTNHPGGIVNEPDFGVTSTNASLGGAVQATAMIPSGVAGILIVGLPSGPTQIAPLSHDVWLNPAAYEFSAFGVTSPLTASVAIPNLAALSGATLGWQAIALDGAVFTSSNPSLSLVR